MWGLRTSQNMKHKARKEKEGIFFSPLLCFSSVKFQKNKNSGMDAGNGVWVYILLLEVGTEGSFPSWFEI